MTTFAARDYLPDWVMLLCALIFIMVPLYASYHRREGNAWKARAFAFSWLWLILLFFSQGLDLPFITLEVRTLLGRIGILAIGFSGCILSLNGLNDHWVRRVFPRFSKPIPKPAAPE